MAALAGCGLPGFANFVGEVSVFFGAWSNESLRVVMVLGVWGALVIGAVYMLRAVRAVLHGPVPDKWSDIADATDSWRKLPFALLLAVLILFGFVPGLLTEKIKPDADKIVTMINTQRSGDAAERRQSDEPQTAALAQDAATEGAQ
jgi:NADH-quinone oxidoreductase subunit M